MNYPTGKTHIFFLIADPVAHVRAAQFINPLFEKQNLDAFLLALHVAAADLVDVIPRIAKIGNVKGLIFTIPHKETMARLCDDLGPNARIIGAVNAVRIEAGGRLVGEIFDGDGLVATAETNGMAIKDRRVLVVGTGGAGRAVAFGLAAAGAREVAVMNRTRDRAERLAADLATHFPAIANRVSTTGARDIDLVVNCTSLGLHEGDPLPISVETIAPSTDVIDIIAIRDTELMQAARAKGCRVVGGRPMVELQLDAQLRFCGMPPKLSA
jgi:shikimate dehydrogenase